MVTLFRCDIEGCNEPVHSKGKQIDFCTGYINYTESSFNGRTNYEPFERPNINKRDLCENHLRIWCKAVHDAFFGKVEEIEE